MNAAALAYAVEPQPHAGRQVRTIRVLLVEDSTSDAYLTERMLGDSSLSDEFEVTTVPRLVDALSAFDRDSFDAVLLDLNLLDMEGVASVAALNAQVPVIPIIVYSGVSDPRLREEAMMCGACHYLVKGHESPWGLRHLIKQAIMRRQH